MQAYRSLLILMMIFFLLSACAPQTATPEAGITTETFPTEITPYPPPVTNAPTSTQEPYPGPNFTFIPPSLEPPYPVSTETPVQPAMGTVAGKICYPSEFIPAMTAYFTNVTNGEYTELQITENQSDYHIDLLPGRYIAFAYPERGNGGSYSRAVPCGLSVECIDHTTLAFDVRLGETTSGIDICDWYSPESVPPNPKSPAAPLAGLNYTTLEEGF